MRGGRASMAPANNQRKCPRKPPLKSGPLNKRQATYLKGLAEGKSKLDAALRAGYATSVARNAHHVIEGSGCAPNFKESLLPGWIPSAWG